MHILLLPYPFNGLYSRTTWISRHHKGKAFWILLQQKRMGSKSPTIMPMVDGVHSDIIVLNIVFTEFLITTREKNPIHRVRPQLRA